MEDFFYTGPMDYLLFEAELAQGSEKPPTVVMKRKPSETPGETTWSGFGFMQVYEGSTLTFTVPQIFRTMSYYPVIRYEPNPEHPLAWENVGVELIRIDETSDDTCDKTYDLQQISLPGDRENIELDAPFCLEKNQRYQIKLTF